MTGGSKMRMVEPALFSGTALPCLVGGRRKSDGKVVFPMPSGPEAELHDAVELPVRGTLWSYTVQRFRPKTPYRDFGSEQFAPYGVGYIDLGSVIVESRIAGPLERLAIGMEMTLTLVPIFPDEHGEPVFTFAFEPAAEIA